MADDQGDANAPPGFQIRGAVLAFSFALWLGSLALPALISPNGQHTLWGIYILLVGWLGVAGIVDGVSLLWLGALAWWANPFYLWALIASSLKGAKPEFSTNVALGLATLTVLVDSFAVSSDSMTPVIGYGPGALLWFLAILGLAYVVARDGGYRSAPRLHLGLASMLCFIFSAQLVWRATGANASERERLPLYSAKRGFICSTEAIPLKIDRPQPAIGLETGGTIGLEADSKQWLESLLKWRIAAVQVGSTEYTSAPQGSPESETPPYMVSQPVTVAARYTLRVEGGYPYVNKWSDGGYFVRMILIDNQTKSQIGELVHIRERNRNLGFCPALTSFPHSRNEEARRWLAPFVIQQ